VNPADAKITAFATQGSCGEQVLDDELRLRTLLERFPARYLRFDRRRKLESCLTVLKALARERPDLVVMEGTGIAGGAAVLAARALFRTRYVLSSGDAVAPFVRSAQPAAYPLFAVYEWLLCRFASGFVGWSPYMTGRGLTLGAPIAMTAPGWAPFPRTHEELEAARARVRARLGIAPEAIVFGIAGSLAWTERVGYCYGLELLRALPLALERTDAEVHVLVLGDGPGRPRLEALRNAGLTARAHLPGRVPRLEVPDYLAALDVATLPQSVDGLGSFRYTTKLSEYLSASLPVVTNQIPLAYDLPGDWAFRLPGRAPWDPVFIESLGALMSTVTRNEIAAKRAETARALPLFEQAPQIERFTQFILELCESEALQSGRPIGR
jgi:glycosyltransferase involved in cell wall biosynthesis